MGHGGNDVAAIGKAAVRCDDRLLISAEAGWQQGNDALFVVQHHKGDIVKPVGMVVHIFAQVQQGGVSGMAYEVIPLAGHCGSVSDSGYHLLLFYFECAESSWVGFSCSSLLIYPSAS